MGGGWVPIYNTTEISRFEEQRLTLRIHLGRGSNQQDSKHSNGSTQSTTTTLGTPSPERLSKYATRRLHHHDKIKISVSYPSSENISEPAGHGDVGHERLQSGNALFAVHYNGTNGRESTESQLYRQQQQHGVASSCYLQVGKGLTELARQQSNTSEAGGSGHSRPANKKMGRRNIKAQVKRFRMETKAAKTLAIIVGMFIFCWCPFFTMYIIRPFCQDCVDPLLFSVLFWLGYCNSAVNPMIYALFSKDFRFAFKRIICRCFCSRQSVSLKSSRRGSDMSAIRIRARTPSITPSAAAHSFGDESELHHSEMSNDPSSSSQSSLGGLRKTSLKVPVYEICHPLVMETACYSYVEATTDGSASCSVGGGNGVGGGGGAPKRTQL
ncbi:GM23169 [Drosophila sechellia]|uniref:GM23169 n=1 Tax=Drosophila sechellia TaxID=7238 RepID=B4II89_DROSE|nr:GM23169 [Drosophila sechellia]